jgi:hypothetical protein
VDINRITTIPMPHRGRKAVLRTRAKTAITKADAVPKSKFGLMTPIDLLKWGLDYKRNVRKGWLKYLLVGGELMEDTTAAIKGRFWSDYKAQCLFIQGMQAVLGNEFDPRVSKQGRRENGDFAGNKNGVPQNFLTVKYLLHAYDISYTSYKRMNASENFVSKTKANRNKGKSVFEDKAFAASFYTPYRMYLKQKRAEWMETEVGRNADATRKTVSDLLL